MDKMHLTCYFSYEQGNFLIRLLIAHLLADFALQSKKMVEQKKWISVTMFLHILVVFALTFIFSFSLWIALIISLSHWLIDGLKVSCARKYPQKEALLFLCDQILHVFVIVIIWSYTYNIFFPVLQTLLMLLKSYKITLIILSYLCVFWPVGFILKFILKKLNITVDDTKVEHGGKLIGQYERIIILTFVLLNQFEAIGFLITGKSIIRFAQRDENLKSEYVLVGTMASYAFSILIGVLTNWLVSF